MSVLQRLARQGHRGAIDVLDAYNPDQERDENGRWTGGDAAIAASKTARSPVEHMDAAKLHAEASAKAPKYSHEAQMHWSAHLAHQSLSQTFKGGNVLSEAPKVSSGLSEFLGGPKTQARGTAAQIVERGGKVDLSTAVGMTSTSERPLGSGLGSRRSRGLRNSDLKPGATNFGWKK